VYLPSPRSCLRATTSSKLTSNITHDIKLQYYERSGENLYRKRPNRFPPKPITFHSKHTNELAPTPPPYPVRPILSYHVHNLLNDLAPLVTLSDSPRKERIQTSPKQKTSQPQEKAKSQRAQAKKHAVGYTRTKVVGTAPSSEQRTTVRENKRQSVILQNEPPSWNNAGGADAEKRKEENESWRDSAVGKIYSDSSDASALGRTGEFIAFQTLST